MINESNSKASFWFPIPFIVVALFLFYFLSYLPWHSANKVKSWTKTKCVITYSKLKKEASNDEYEPEVSFKYTFNKKKYTSSKFNCQIYYHGDYIDATKAVNTNPVGKKTNCYVNPKNPNEAVIEITMPQTMVFCGGAFASIFFLAGLITLFKFTLANNPIAQKITKNKFVIFLVSLAFMSIATCFFYFTVYKSNEKISQSKHWAKVECTVIKSKIKIEGSGSKTYYYPKVIYKYLYKNKEYISNKYDFSQSSKEHSTCKKIINKYKVKKKYTCYVNPADPFEAVLLRKGSLLANFIITALFGGLFFISLIFMLTKIFKKTNS